MALGLTQDWQPYHLHVPIVLKSGSLNLLEPSGPVQACNGIALHILLLTLWRWEAIYIKYKNDVIPLDKIVLEAGK